jgi:uncharacterized protein
VTAAADVIVVGGGLAGLVAAAELVSLGKRVAVVEQEGEQNLGGQAFWSLGGLFLVNSPEQRRLGIRDSAELALEDWLGTAAFDRNEDHWPRLWAHAYVEFAAGEMRSWLRQLGIQLFPIVGWAERGGYGAIGHGNSVPRFHVTWGTGPAVVAPFEQRLQQASARGKVAFKFRHRVDALMTTNGAVDGVRGTILEPTDSARGVESSRTAIGEFTMRAQAVIIASGGIGGNLDRVRSYWPKRLGDPPRHMLCGVPAHVDGRMLDIAERAGASLINRDRMWHYVEGLHNWNPIWRNHGIRILAGPSSIWFDARGRRFPAPLFPGYDTLGTLHHIAESGFEYSWFVLTQSILRKEFALSGSEQNPDLTGRDWRKVLGRAFAREAPEPIRAFAKRGIDFVVRDDVASLAAGMNALIGGDERITAASLKHEIAARDLQLDNAFSKDSQITAIRGVRKYFGDRLIRTARPHKFLDPAHGPLVAVRLNILTRKTLGGLQTDLRGRVLDGHQQAIVGLYAAGEVAGFGGGGMHGYRSLEGTFLGGCLLSGRIAGQAAARDLA